MKAVCPYDSVAAVVLYHFKSLLFCCRQDGEAENAAYCESWGNLR